MGMVFKHGSTKVSRVTATGMHATLVTIDEIREAIRVDNTEYNMVIRVRLLPALPT